MKYLNEIKRIIEIIKKEEVENIERVATILAKAMASGNNVYTFGASHAGIMSEELFYRAGGIALFNPIFGSEVMLDQRPITHTSRMEMLDGYGTLLAEKVNINPGDVVLLHSVSGRNSVAIDLAHRAKEKGAFIIAITNLTYSKSVTSRSKTGLRLFEIADIVIDNHGCIGDACVEIEGVAQKIAPTSTVIGCLIANSIVTRTVEKLVEMNVTPVPVFYSANLDGGSEQNRKIFEQYKDQIHYM